MSYLYYENINFIKTGRQPREYTMVVPSHGAYESAGRET